MELIAYTFDLGRDPEYKYFKFESDDLGETWNFVEEVDKNDLEWKVQFNKKLRKNKWIIYICNV